MGVEPGRPVIGLGRQFSVFVEAGASREAEVAAGLSKLADWLVALCRARTERGHVIRLVAREKEPVRKMLKGADLAFVEEDVILAILPEDSSIDDLPQLQISPGEIRYAYESRLKEGTKAVVVKIAGGRQRLRELLGRLEEGGPCLGSSSRG